MRRLVWKSHLCPLRMQVTILCLFGTPKSKDCGQKKLVVVFSQKPTWSSRKESEHSKGGLIPGARRWTATACLSFQQSQNEHKYVGVILAVRFFPAPTRPSMKASGNEVRRDTIFGQIVHAYLGSGLLSNGGFQTPFTETIWSPVLKCLLEIFWSLWANLWCEFSFAFVFVFQIPNNAFVSCVMRSEAVCHLCMQKTHPVHACQCFSSHIGSRHVYSNWLGALLYNKNDHAILYIHPPPPREWSDCRLKQPW